jgi:hypothetical protein
MAAATASAPLDLTIQQYVEQNPLVTEYNFDGFGINPMLFEMAINLEHEIRFKISYTSNQIENHTQIGKNVTDVMKLKALCDGKKIPFNFDMAKVVFEFKITFSIWLKEKSMPFSSSIKDILDMFAEQSHNVVTFVALALAYDNIEICRSSILDRAFNYQLYGLPPLRSYESVILTKALNPPIQVLTPFNPNFSCEAISPIPSLVPEDGPEDIRVHHEPSEDGPEDIRVQHNPSEDGQYQYPGRRRHQRYIYGAGLPPVSVDAIYNDKPIEKQPFRVQSWGVFNSNGEKGIVNFNGEKTVIPLNERFRRFTSFVMTNHPPVRGKRIDDQEVIAFMRNELGNHFGDWNKFDWSKINLSYPFPAENPPMKSA